MVKQNFTSFMSYVYRIISMLSPKLAIISIIFTGKIYGNLLQNNDWRESRVKIAIE